MHEQSTTGGPKKQGDGNSFIHQSLRDARLTPHELAVFIQIKGRGKCFAGDRRIAQDAILSRNTVRSVKRRLLERNMIKVTGRGHPPGRPDLETDIYEATHPSEWLQAKDRGSNEAPRTKTDRGPNQDHKVTNLKEKKVSFSNCAMLITENGTKETVSDRGSNDDLPSFCFVDAQGKIVTNRSGTCHLCRQRIWTGEEIHLINRSNAAHPNCYETSLEVSEKAA